MSIKKQLLVAVAAINTACAGMLRIPLPPREEAPEPFEHAALCPENVEDAAKVMASYARPPGKAERGTTFVLYELHADAEFTEHYGKDAPALADQYRASFEHAAMLTEKSAALRFVPVTDQEAVETLHDEKPLTLTVVVSGGRDPDGAADAPTFGTTTIGEHLITLYVPDIEAKALRLPTAREQTVLHELTHYLTGIHLHVDDLFSSIKHYKNGQGANVTEFTDPAVDMRTTNFTRQQLPVPDGIPELDLCTLAQIYGTVDGPDQPQPGAAQSFVERSNAQKATNPEERGR